MLPERSVFRTDSFYEYRKPGEDVCKDGGGVGSAFILKRIGLLTACHCVRNITTGAQHENYCLSIESHHSMNCKVEIESLEPFTCNVADDWALARTPSDFQSISGLSVAAKTLSLQRGEKVVGYGYADGKNQLRRIEVRVAEILKSEIVVDRAFIKGMSGGPVLNSRGEAVGVITQGSGENTYSRDGRFLLLDAIPAIAELRG